jgi:hypothetical protein
MRYKIWITLIVCGTLIVLASPVSDYFATYQVSRVMVERKDANNINFFQRPAFGLG